MDKQNVVHTYNGLASALKRKGILMPVTTRMHFEDMLSAKQAGLQRTNMRESA